MENNFPLATFLISIHQILKTNIMKISKTIHKVRKNRFVSNQYTFLLALLVGLMSTGIYAQTATGLGIRAGLNYNANGNYFESVSANAEHPDRNIGYHFGLFGKIGNQIYLKPEVVYTTTKSDYSSNSFEMQKN